MKLDPVCIVCHQRIPEGVGKCRHGSRWRHIECKPKTDRRMTAEKSEEEIRNALHAELAGDAALKFSRGRVIRKAGGEQ